MNSRPGRILLAVTISFALGSILLIINGGTVSFAIGRAFVFSLVVGLIVAVLSWAIEYAKSKGYAGWVGFWAVFLLNILGVLLLLVLPSRTRME